MRKLLFITLALLLYALSYSQTQSNVSTPKGNSVTAYIVPEMTDTERQYYDNQYSALNRTLLYYFNDNRSSSKRFNCHGYAWNMSEGGPVRWIGYYVTTDEDVYMTDGSYIRVCNEIYPGKVSWVGGDHSAITTATPGRWRSKWNMFPLMEHNKDDTPFGTNYAYYASTKISGSTSSLCSGTRIFSVKNIPGATYSWTHSATVTPVGPTNTSNLTVQRNGSSNGAAWAQVQITTPCSGTSATSRIDFTVGLPAQPGSITERLVDYYQGKLQLEIAAVPGATSYRWYKDGVLQTTSYGTFIQMPITQDLCNIGYGIEVEALNGCGTSPKRYQGVYVPCDESYFILSPNPASSDVTVSSNQTKTQSAQNQAIDEIRIFDFQGNLKKHQKFDKVKTARINIATLNNGTYFVEVTNGNYKERHQLLIQK